MACERFCFYTDCGITACGSGTPTKLSNNSSGARPTTIETIQS